MLRLIVAHLHELNWFAFALAMFTLVFNRLVLKFSIFIPAPLISLAVCTLLAATVLSGSGVTLVGQKYGTIPSNFFVFTGPSVPGLTPQVILDIVYFVVAIVFVSGVESLLCSSMADRLANNKKTPFNPDKEFWGQGWVQILTPLVNGFPCTGALARTATSIKAGAVTPFAGYFKGVLKITMAIFIAPYLEMVPMACIGGTLLWVATNMVKPAEIKEVWKSGKLEGGMMAYTAVMVPMTDFLTGVLSAMILYAVLARLTKAKRLATT
jgi:sulfate permease, SulP family